MSWLKRVWRWCKRNWKLIAGVLSILVAAIVGATCKDDIKKALLQRKKIAVTKNQMDIARLEGKREMIRKRDGELSEEVRNLDQEIKILNEQVKINKQEIARMTAEEKLKKFKELGY